MSISTADTSAEGLREAMIAKVKDAGYELGSSLEEALRTVERHLFVPHASLVDAYANDTVVTKRADGGKVLSCLSQPSIVALQLGQLDARPGHRILEIGAGGGYNAALLAHLVGPQGSVTTIDVDADIVADARRNLHAAGVTNVAVLHGDGALGHPDGAPFDRIVATVGAYGIPDSWLSQLAPGGRLVVPLRLRGSVSRSVVFERDGSGRWRSMGSEMCTFMPLRGVADDTRRTIDLIPDAMVTLEAHQDQVVDPGALGGVLRQRRVSAWTGVRFGGMESMEWLYLWLACSLPNAISRMPVTQAAVDLGLVTPQFGWGAMATFDQGNLTYLTVRKYERAPERERVYEIGLVGHGPGSDEQLDRMLDAIHAWDRHHRSDTVDFEIRPTAVESATGIGIGVDVPVPPTDTTPGQFVIGTPPNRSS